jgi:hypothetical protein
MASSSSSTGGFGLAKGGAPGEGAHDETGRRAHHHHHAAPRADLDGRAWLALVPMICARRRGRLQRALGDRTGRRAGLSPARSLGTAGMGAAACAYVACSETESSGCALLRWDVACLPLPRIIVTLPHAVAPRLAAQRVPAYPGAA